MDATDGVIAGGPADVLLSGRLAKRLVGYRLLGKETSLLQNIESLWNLRMGALLDERHSARGDGYLKAWMSIP